jgi:hypothetical protein
MPETVVADHPHSFDRMEVGRIGLWTFQLESSPRTWRRPLVELRAFAIAIPSL